MIKVEMTNYDTANVEVTSIPEFSMEYVSVSYDGGRLSVYVGDVEVLKTSFAGNSFNVEVKVVE
jgi:hypothetical protein